MANKTGNRLIFGNHKERNSNLLLRFIMYQFFFFLLIQVVVHHSVYY